MNHCINYAERINPRADMIVNYFKVIDSNELFTIAIGWDKDSEIYSQIGFCELGRKGE